MRLGRIAAEEKQGFGVAYVGVAIGHRAVAPGIGYAGDGGGMADASLVVGVIGAPERRKFSVQISCFIGELGRPQPVEESGPDLSRIAISLSPISLIAVSHEIRFHWPFT